MHYSAELKSNHCMFMRLMDLIDPQTELISDKNPEILSIASVRDFCPNLQQEGVNDGYLIPLHLYAMIANGSITMLTPVSQCHCIAHQRLVKTASSDERNDI